MPEMFAVGSSSFARTVAASLFALVANNAIITYGDESHLAIIGVASRILLFVLMPLFGLIHGLQPIVGFNYGARNFARVREALRTAMWASVAYCTLFYLLIVSLSRPIIKLFGDDPFLVEEGPQIIVFSILVLPTVGVQVIGASFFQALGKALPSLFFSTSRQVLFLVPLVLTLPLAFGLLGVWYALPAADMLATVVTLIWVGREIRIIRSLENQALSSGS
jgi:Na+-driven multidrug efflux pump